LDSINGGLSLHDNSVVETLDGFQKLNYIKDELYVGVHNNLADLDALSNIKSVSWLWIAFNEHW
jgi:hypothetical protein